MSRIATTTIIVLAAVALVGETASAAEYYPFRGLRDPSSEVESLVKKSEESPTPELLTTAGWLLHVYRNENKKAQELFEQALASQPGNAWARYGLCVIHEISGDFDAVVANGLALCESSPSHPLAVLALLQLRSLFGKIAHFNERVEPALQSLLDEGRSHSIQFDEIGRDILSAIGGLKGEAKAQKRLVQERGCITEWRIVGPFGEFPNLSFLSTWPPESDRALKSHYKDGDRLRETKRYSPAHGRLRPYWLTPGVHYAETFLRPSSSREVILRISSYSACELFLNNHRIYRKDTVRGHCPVTEYIQVRLSPGYNRVLLKFLHGGRAHYSSAAPFGSLDDECVMSEPIKRSPVVQVLRYPYGPAAVRVSASPHRWRRRKEAEVTEYVPPVLGYFDALSNENPDDALALGLRGILNSVQGDVQAAKNSVRAAVKRVPSYSYFNYILGTVLRDDDSLPTQTRQGDAEARFRSAIDAAGTFPLTLYQMALLDIEKDKDLEAVDKLNQCIAQSPGYLPWHESLYEVYEKKGWGDERRRQLETILALHLDSCRPYHLAEEYYGSTKQYDELAGTARKLQTMHVNADFLARHYYQTGQDGKAIAEYLKLKKTGAPSERDRRSLIDLYERNDRWVEAEGELKESLRLFPRAVWFLKELAAVKGHTGHPAAERRAWNRILREYPVDQDARRALRAAGQKDMLDEFDVPSWPRIQDESLREKYAGVSSVLIIDQVVEEIYPDGSGRQKTHQLILLNDKNAIDEWGELNIPEEELLELRTIKMDGTVVEPERPQGSKGTVSMGGLQEGDFIEYKYITRNAAYHERPRRFLGDLFFFQSVDVPMELSQYVVIVPEDMHLEYEQVNFDRDPKVLLKRGKKVYLWEAREVPAIPNEPLAAANTEFLPFVRVGVNFDEDEGILRYQDHNIQMTKITGEIREVTADALADCPPDLESRVRAIHSFVNKEVRGGDGSAYIGSPASVTLVDRRGDRLGLAKAMLDVAGIESQMVLVRGKLAHTSEVFPGSFTSALLGILDSEGRFAHVLDFSNRYLPFGYIRSDWQGGDAVALQDFSSEDFGSGRKRKSFHEGLFTVPRLPIEDNSEQRKLTAAVRDDGTVEGTHIHEFRGDAAASLRDAMVTAQAYQIENFVERMASASYRAAVLKDQKVENLLDVEKPLLVEYVFQAPNFGRVTGEEMVLDQWLPSLRLGATFASLQVRKTPLQINTDLHSRFQAVLEIPSEAKVETVPSPLNLRTDFGFYQLRVGESDGSIHVEGDFFLKAQRISPDDYPRFAEFCRSVDEAERKEIRLRGQP
jgi:tetratricopeptide (TPR) repeat protein